MPESATRTKMIVMPGADTGFDAGVLFGRFPDRMGHLFGPDFKKGPPRTEYPWALDNGVYGAWAGRSKWSEKPLFDFLHRFSFLKPAWVAVPDWVGDREETLRRWDQYYPALNATGVPLAFVAQDGMTPDDVPHGADVVFVGGTDSWKWRNLRTWTENFPRVHVGRVNTYRLLWMAHEAGAESCDGTGWFRGDRNQLAGLVEYLEESSRSERPQRELCLAQ